MSRHLVNRQRRLANRPGQRPEPGREPEERPEAEEAEREGGGQPVATLVDTREKPDAGKDAEEAGERPAKAADRERRKAERPVPPRAQEPSDAGPGRSRRVLIGVLAAVTVIFGVFAVYANSRAGSEGDSAAAENTALVDTARTSEIIGSVSEAVNDLFSYDSENPAALEESAREHLTGDAVDQHAQLLAPVIAAGEENALVLTTTVTHAGVELIDGDRARVLFYADQSNTRLGEEGDTNYSAAVLAVDVVNQDGEWKIAAFDTFA
ncbi:hypothetical protein RM780_13340 [Streptomyces sp. DSM 44917]|uniref:Mce-associated membrane protein n=1 Tax=Streptomyces boetiae TaxID=3075541 RepID=A0ABU2L8Q0_9ACTN|nr:hypothetical protein [Streptomyces sp. DSM 44917]MDT0307941.1 hypothetical protein [Streptomyces sp. DSM 44917]